MRRNYKKGGYSTDIANSYIDSQQPIRLLSTQLTSQVKFVNNQPTDEIAAYKAWFTQKGQEPFEVKFETKVKLPEYLALVAFVNLQACEFRHNVYFKAAGLKEVK